MEIVEPVIRIWIMAITSIIEDEQMFSLFRHTIESEYIFYMLM